ncbi:enhancer of polycomb homolog 1-like [Antedon mediterranea]|uniref:enhancer of polycomb homolog 1-like n=1 Tax=Antedon mediterranea TaxID=105859 RepID=UPI003AF600B4
MSKLSFRARALDASKPMPIYKSEELPDLPDFSAINRAVPQMPSGMEKEEESEHHLQRAISAQQVYGSANHLVIPTPDCKFINKENYEQVYDGTFKQPRQYIHVQTLGMEQETPDYDIDSDDDEWVKKQAKTFDITSRQFEEMMDRLEKGSGQTVVNLKEAKLLLKEDDDLIIAVYDYWLNKRLSIGHSLIPTVKQEKRDGSTTSNPYVAFRRRTEKMQTRKNRKNDEVSYEKMLKLRRDLNRAVTLLEMVKRREKYKKEKLHLTIEVFEKRYHTQDYSGELLRECEELAKKQPSYSIPVIPNGNHYKSWSHTEEAVRKKREYKKRKHKVSTDKQRQRKNLYNELDPRFHDYRLSDEDISPVQSISDQEEENDPDGTFAFRRRKGCNYHAPHSRFVCGWPWSNQHIKDISDKRYRYCCTSLKVKESRKCIGFARRRIGRGGRIVLDRAHTGVDNELYKLDTSVFNPENKQSSSSWQNSVSLSTQSLDDSRGRYRGSSQSSTWPSTNDSLPPLDRIIADIRASRMPHYRPKTPPPMEATLNVETPKQSVLEDNLLTNFLTQTSSKPPQQILSDMETFDEIAETSLKEKPITDVESQTIEVDVGSPTSTSMNACFSTLPTSKFTLEPSTFVNSPSVPVVEQLPLLVQPADSSQNTTNESDNKNNSIVTLEPVVEVTGRGPILASQGHSTAPAATVLQLNYPIPAAVKTSQNTDITADCKQTISSTNSNNTIKTMNNSIQLASIKLNNATKVEDEQAIKLNLKTVSKVNSLVNKAQSMPSSTVVRFTSSSSKIGSLSSNHDGPGGLGNQVKTEKTLLTEVT